MGAGASAGQSLKPTSATDFESNNTTINGLKGGVSYFIELGKCEAVEMHVEVAKTDSAVVALPRGGILVNYSTGTVQFGLPPETIKDALLWGLNVPTTFVILGEEMFDRQLGINIAEFEFPAYFNYFVNGKRVTLITTASVEKRVRAIFRETLLGPEPGSYDLSQDFSSKLSGGLLGKQHQDTHWPDFVLEGLALDRQREFITVDKLLNFEILENTKQINLARIRGRSDKKNSMIRPNSTGKIMLDQEANAYVKWNPLYKKFVVREGKRTIAQVDHRFLKPRIKQERKVKHEPFDVPIFGVTMLGTSHGFDPKGTTTGFVVWVNRRGIMVDPPPDSADVLRDMAIPARLIDGMILTHCHADHDAGAFQKILAETSIKIYTTQTIMDSFIRKYAAISNLEPNFLRGLFVFERVKIGKQVIIHGGTWDFFYSLHVIPTIGFEVKFANEGIVYSGDTCTNPKLFEKMRREKRIGKGRYEDLMKRSPVSRSHPARKLPDGTFIQAYRPHILHEAGVPPIHTPLDFLAKLPLEIRERLFVVHVDEKSLSEGKNGKKLRTIPQWSTLRIDVDSSSPEVVEKHNSLPAIISTVHFFKYFKELSVIDALLAIGKVSFHKKGTALAEPGSQWDTVYVVRAGVIVERTDDQDGPIEDQSRSSFSRTSSGDLSRVNSSGSVSSADSNDPAKRSQKPETIHKPTFYYVADFVGSQSLLEDDYSTSSKPRHAREVQHAVFAHTDLYTIEFGRDKLMRFLESSEVGRNTLANIRSVAMSQNQESWNVLRLNNTLEKIMNRVQQQEFQKILSLPRKYARYETIFNRGSTQECMFLIAVGFVNLYFKPKGVEAEKSKLADEIENVDLGPGALVGDVNCLTANTIARYTLTAKTECVLYEVERISLMNFLNRYPGIKLQAIDRRFLA